MILMCCNANGESQPTIKQQDYKKNDKVDCMNYYAHTKDNEPKNKWQRLSEHLHNTAQIAECFTNIAEYKDIFRIAALLHDLGKYQPAFQNYLEMGGRRGSVPHASWGAGYAHILGLNEISITIDGHHKGLPDRANWKNDVSDFTAGEISNFTDVIESFLMDTGLTETYFKCKREPFLDQFEFDMFIRYLFSAVTDADWLDTEKFCSPEIYKQRIQRKLDCEYLIKKLDTEIQNKSKEGKLNNLRNQVREYALSMSDMPMGFYSLALPTGMGKTLTSVSWALRHARKHNLKRIIIVLPYINIIDQTALILKTIFGKEWVLEHHSGNNDNIETSEDGGSEYYEQRLACENWEYPIIITTTVQFFESLFSNKPSRCRKLHNISESVVIFDEVQSLPKELISPTLTMLNNLHSILRVSFLFCTATLPAFESREGFRGIESITPLVENPVDVFKKTCRVEYASYNNNDPSDINELAAVAANQHCALLAVFNTKRSAREFHSAAINTGGWDVVYHLSTAMCPHHRKTIINAIRDDLIKSRKILVSSTQLIEAGVDFDFPCVFREMAPLESIIQAAGRCNREGKMDEKGKVYIFKLVDGGMPDKLYRSSSEFTLELLQNDFNRLYDHDFYSDYYRKLVKLYVNVDKNKINDSRKSFNFETVAQSYRIIEKATESLFIHMYNEESDDLCKTISNKKFLSREDYRRLQEYSIQVYQHFLTENASLFNVHVSGVKTWHGGYDKHTGISVEPITSDQMVV